MSGKKSQVELADLEEFVSAFRSGSSVPITPKHDLLIQKLANVFSRLLSDIENADWQKNAEGKTLDSDLYRGGLVLDGLGLRKMKAKSGHSSLSVRTIDVLLENLHSNSNFNMACDYVCRIRTGEKEKDILERISGENGKSLETNKRTIARYRDAANKLDGFLNEIGKLDELE